MNIRFYNARILSMKDGYDVINGELTVRDGIISYVGTGKAKEEEDYDRQIDCHQNLLMPGFKNAHTHSGMSVLRSLADDLPLSDWLNTQIFPVEAKMTPDDIYTMTKLSVLEYLTSGITACFDMYLTPESIARSMDDCGFRCVQTGAINNFSQSVELLEKMYLEYNKPGSLQSYILGAHAEYTTSLELLKEISGLVHKYRAPFFMHLGETKGEVEGCIQRYGKGPLKLADEIGLFDFGGGIYHGIYLDDEDFSIMKKRGLYVVTNPASNIKLASGICPVDEYLKNDIPVAIGTDGPASNNCLDMFREMFLVAGLTKLRTMDASAADANEILKMATVNGALCMGLKDCDILDTGKKADIILLDLNAPNMQPVNNITKNIVYSGSKLNVKMTMVNGNILYENGEFYIDESPEQIYEKVTSIKKRLLNG
ncbi:MAG: amidohydrolase [Lachnospiraceae bacterium]|nr:amidohydrolase [Lachnospiraceae bacterium]